MALHFPVAAGGWSRKCNDSLPSVWRSCGAGDVIDAKGLT